ncbi:MAG: radical SAM protein, partial [Anaerolineae bacterium]|nr:radical SAM protein [Anaerolineae bacterium]
MKLTGLHLLLTYQCTYECDHCFVWGSPWQSGTMTAAAVDHILREGKSLGTVDSIYFEGGEPFLYYATLLFGVRRAVIMGFSVGIVSNAYWATSVPDAIETLRPFAGLVQDLSLSVDRYHDVADVDARIEYARIAAAEQAIPVGAITIAQPEGANRPAASPDASP